MGVWNAGVAACQLPDIIQTDIYENLRPHLWAKMTHREKKCTGLPKVATLKAKCMCICVLMYVGMCAFMPMHTACLHIYVVCFSGKILH